MEAIRDFRDGRKFDNFSSREECVAVAFQLLFAQFYSILTKKISFAEALHVFYDCIKETCCNSYKTLRRRQSRTTQVVLAALHIINYLSMSVLSTELLNLYRDVDSSGELILFCCFFLNYENRKFIQCISTNSCDHRLEARRKIAIEFIEDQRREASHQSGKLLFLSKCAHELGVTWLERKIKHLIQPLRHNFNIVENDPDICHDGVVYNRLRDPPGQRSVYIPPGDTAKETYRLSTYIRFPQEVPVNPRDLASAGFSYTGYKDRVKCFCCGLCIENWCLGDDVSASRWHRSDCNKMLGRECGNIGIGGALARLHTQPRPNGFAGRDIPSSSNASTALPSTSSDEMSSNNHDERINGGITMIQTSSASFARSPVNVETTQSNTSNTLIALASISSVYHEQLVRNLDLRKESDRVITFENWPTQHRTVHRSELARCGFFYLGNLDRVQCFSCGGILRNWKFRDNVEMEHRRHFPHCRMGAGTDVRNVALSPGDREIPAVPLELVSHEPPDPTEEEMRDLREMFQCLYPVNPHMRSAEARHATFDGRWHAERIQATTIQISKSGFFYLGERDRVKCWYCNGGLQNWDPEDEPWTEHAKWFPRCEFVLQQKGPDFVHRIVSMFPTLQRPMVYSYPVLDHSLARTQRSPPPRVIDPREELRNFRDRLKRIMTSEMVKSAIEMGFQSSSIRCIVKRKLRSNENYSTVLELIDDLTSSSFSQSDSDSDNSGDESPAISTNVEISGGSSQHEAEEIIVQAAGDGAIQVAEGRGVSDDHESMETEVANNMETSQASSSSIEDRIRQIHDERRCKICLDNPAEVLFVPCGHLCTCTDCSQAVRNCPICRIKIQKSVKIYTE